MQSLLSQYKELEGKPIHHSDAKSHKDSEKLGLTARIEFVEQITHKVLPAPHVWCHNTKEVGSGEQPSWQ
jgi:hypothetical protein